MKSELLANVRDFLAQPLPNHIGGQPSMTATAEVVNPSDGSVLAQVAMAGAKEIDLAVTAAAKAFPAWSALTPGDRAKLLHRFANALEKHSAELAQLESLDVGKPIATAESFDIPFGIECFRYFADLSTRAQLQRPAQRQRLRCSQWRVPYGVCGFIFPWNFPFTLLCWGIAPALAAGNTVVVKPSEMTPLTRSTPPKSLRKRACRPACSTSLQALVLKPASRSRPSAHQAHLVYRIARSGQENRRTQRAQPHPLQAGTRRQRRGSRLRRCGRRFHRSPASRSRHLEYRPGLLHGNPLDDPRENL